MSDKKCQPYLIDEDYELEIGIIVATGSGGADEYAEPKSKRRSLRNNKDNIINKPSHVFVLNINNEAHFKDLRNYRPYGLNEIEEKDVVATLASLAQKHIFKERHECFDIHRYVDIFGPGDYLVDNCRLLLLL
jgi:hypothetical protein